MLSDEWEEMSVVTTDSKIARVLESTDFRKLLKSLGLKQPTEQVRE